MTTSAATSASVDWDEVLRLVPGYDPFGAAGDCVFDIEAAERVVGFFRDCLTHEKGAWAGQPIELVPWQQAVVGDLFGWKRPDGTRRYREAFVFVPRKQGKTVVARQRKSGTRKRSWPEMVARSTNVRSKKRIKRRNRPCFRPRLATPQSP